jgi:hypothetical protein
MAGVKKACHQFEFDLMRLHQPIDHRSSCPRRRQRLIIGRMVMRLGDKILRKQLRAVVYARLPLEVRTGCRNEAGRERRRATGVLVPLKHQNLLPLIMRRKCGNKTTGAGADNDHRHLEVEGNAFSR